MLLLYSNGLLELSSCQYESHKNEPLHVFDTCTQIVAIIIFNAICFTGVNIEIRLLKYFKCMYSVKDDMKHLLTLTSTDMLNLMSLMLCL